MLYTYLLESGIENMVVSFGSETDSFLANITYSVNSPESVHGEEEQDDENVVNTIPKNNSFGSEKDSFLANIDYTYDINFSNAEDDDGAYTKPKYPADTRGGE